MLAHFFS